MARRRRITQPEFIKQGGELLSKNKAKVAVALLTFAVIVFAALWLKDLFFTSSYFDFNRIEVVKFSAEEGLKPKKEFFELNATMNIFTADPALLANKIRGTYPEFQKVIINKFLPNRVVALIVDRRPIAKIKVGRVYAVDFEGMVLPQISDEELKSLPLIIGLESQLFNPAPGKKIRSDRLAKGLSILSFISTGKEFKGSTVETVDLSYPDKTNFKMDGITVVIGDNEYEGKLESLAITLSNPKIIKARIDSIDLRFTDPAVIFKRVMK